MDKRSIKGLFSFCGVLAATPYGKFDDNLLRYSQWTYLFQIVNVVLTSGSMAFYWRKIYEVKAEVLEVFIILHTCLNGIALYRTLFLKKKCWIELLKLYFEIDGVLSTMRKVDRNKKLLCWIYLICNFIIILTAVIPLILNGEEVIAYILLAYREFYVTANITIMIWLLLSFRCRFEEINESLTEYLTVYNPDLFYSRSVELGRIFRIMGHVTLLFNKIFGTLLFTSFAFPIIFTLNYAHKTIISRRFVWDDSLPKSVLHVIGCVSLVLSCDAVVSEANKLVPICMSLYESVPRNSPQRSELICLVERCKCYQPKFTAANLFTIKKNTLFGIVNVAITYLIVLIQFNSL